MLLEGILSGKQVAKMDGIEAPTEKSNLHPSHRAHHLKTRQGSIEPRIWRPRFRRRGSGGYSCWHCQFPHC
jgi:hypothetical protein